MLTREPVDVTERPHFVGCWQFGEPAIAADLIDWFEARTHLTRPGAIGDGQVVRAAKDSTDLEVLPKDLDDESHAPVRRYIDALNACYADYLAQWPFLDGMLERVHIGPFNLQKYATGGHFADLHTERTSMANLQRVLVWMTYLNDVEADGETEFVHYGLKVAPRAGRTLIWPAEWTHAHRGCPVGAGEKYIITGWFHFPDA